jgi:hypothetical protein
MPSAVIARLYGAPVVRWGFVVCRADVGPRYQRLDIDRTESHQPTKLYAWQFTALLEAHHRAY